VRDQRRRTAFVAATAIGAAILCAASAGASEGGLVLVPEWKTTLPALILLFALLIIPVNLLIFRPVFRVLDARADKLDGTRKRAAKLARNADESLSRYEQSVREVREDAERDRKQRLEGARRDHAARTASARAEAEREVVRARAEVATALAESRVSLRAQAEELAVEAAARVLGRVLS
jgi:F-type H+-transporting ATPase subunit b